MSSALFNLLIEREIYLEQNYYIEANSQRFINYTVQKIVQGRKVHNTQLNDLSTK